MTIRPSVFCGFAVAVTAAFMMAGCYASRAGAPSFDGGTDALRPRPDGGRPFDARASRST